MFLNKINVFFQLATKVGQGLNKVLDQRIQEMKQLKRQALVPEFPHGLIRRIVYKELVAGVDMKSFSDPKHVTEKFQAQQQVSVK